MRRALFLVAAVAGSACVPVDSGRFNELTFFDVRVTGVYVGSGATRTPLDVVNSCAVRFGGQDKVPAAERGTLACEYIIPRGVIETDVEATALSLDGTRLNSFNGPVSLRMLPGEIVGTYDARTGVAVNGEVRSLDGGAVRLQSIHAYGQVRVWVEDGPPRPIFDGGVELKDTIRPEPTCDALPCVKRTLATGVSPIIHFDDQTLQSLQQPDGYDNRSSQFVGEFVSVGRNPESGSTLVQSCADDPARDGQPVLMVVTGVDPAGFYVTDVSACRLPEPPPDGLGSGANELPEPCLATRPDGSTAPIEEIPGATAGTCAISRKSCAARSACRNYLPGTYGSMFVYNFNYPDGLDEGDLLFTLSGSVQEFTSTSQLVFPAWTIAEKVRRLPPAEWTKWLKLAPPVPITQRTCGGQDQAAAFYTDQLCGQNRRNLKLESLESTLAKVKNVRFPEEVEGCDFNGDNSIACFAESERCMVTLADGSFTPAVGRAGLCETSGRACTGDASGFTRDCNSNSWGSCGAESASDRRERECAVACTIGTGAHAGKICTERTNLNGFGQFVVELAPPGLAAAGLDDSLPARMTTRAVGQGVAAERIGGFVAGQQVVVGCDTPAAFRVGDGTVVASATDTAVGAKSWKQVTLSTGESSVSVIGTGAAGKCSVALNTHVRFQLIVKDAVPELVVDCRVDDPDADRATQCRALRGATFDVVGHLKQVQPARPRWLITPRDPTDLCCRPGPGLQCPRPIARCAD